MVNEGVEEEIAFLFFFYFSLGSSSLSYFLGIKQSVLGFLFDHKKSRESEPRLMAGAQGTVGPGPKGAQGH